MMFALIFCLQKDALCIIPMVHIYIYIIYRYNERQKHNCVKVWNTV